MSVYQPDPTTMPESDYDIIYVDSYVHFSALVKEFQPIGGPTGPYELYAATAGIYNNTTDTNLFDIDTRMGEGNKSISVSDSGGAYYTLYVVTRGGSSEITATW